VKIEIVVIEQYSRSFRENTDENKRKLEITEDDLKLPVEALGAKVLYHCISSKLELEKLAGVS